MRFFIECLPYLSGVLIGLYLANRVNKPLSVGWLVGIFVSIGLLINRLSGELFPLVVVDTGVVLVVSVVTYYARRMVSGL
ncbi:hypothetical protein JYG30_00445 [Fibrella sp. USSR17]